ncbi:ABC transporter substrate-binding protein [Tessaracoccus rhinocerotis]|uniref:ABC transporter substrate-binding protein n=1 Tax=Tessaracoccus rhinocerotis TaxID=1689449 RepID=A0A553K278_9ACTN|nr:ABC transporter substrate-binding protein [Tessaracoccus rhinocerotis]TRY18803.1 ABC transporter substrate-binding protein [Tessaracoccus rhinocerotis]
MNLRRRTLLAGALGLPLTALAACAPQEQAPPESAQPTDVKTRLTVGLTYIPNVQFSPFYLAVAQDVFARSGLDVRLRHHGAQEDAFGALLSGEEDVVFASSDEAVVAAVQAPELRTFATAYQTFPGVVIVPADAGVTTVADLRGRRVGIPGHFGSTYYSALAALHNAGLDEADVELTDIGFTQVAALSSGKVDAIVGFTNNETVQFRMSGFDVVELPVQPADEVSLVGPGLVTVAGRLEDAVLSRVAEAMREAEAMIIADPELAMTATQEHVPTLADEAQREAAAAVLEATSGLWLRDGEPSVAVDEAAFERMGGFLVDVGIIETAPAETTIIL